jgi:uncharacterized protein
MAAAIKTPGVYIVEKNAFPNSVVQVATAVPAFIGYTEKVPPGPNVPTRLSSLAEYESYFGKGPKTQFTFTDVNKPPDMDPKSRFLLYSGMRLFFDNGGGPCWIVSIGTYDSATKADKKKDDFLGALPQLEKVLEPTMLVAPDAVLLSEDDWQAIGQQFLIHCNKMQSRVSILDVYNGSKSRTYKDDDVIQHFRDRITSDFLNYGQTYYPWVNTSIVDDSDVDYSVITDASLGAFQTALKNAIASVPDPAKKAISDLIDKMPAAKAPAAPAGGNATPAQPATGGGGTPAAPAPNLLQIHRSLRAVSPVYVNVMSNIRQQLNLLPPSGGMAGVYTRIDNALGVFKAPANTGLMSVVSPAVDITNDDQEDLNAPLDGKAVNAIRTFPGRGLLVWGARTLDGNSQDWRYINVRRTIIMLEQSIKYATLAYVFEANNASTWVTVKNMISNFLVNQWKAGALVGAKPDEAFSVDVGLGSTMTPDDILNGFMYVTVKVALVRPAEFIVITFQQKMQTS